ncbi:hypothetical protein [Mesorhizobium sp.]|uniref:hypothetical protein n=1 Tax=Mesorhizobium sp. TaxID=1871066 RepID=UPI000FE3B568|nr:hypothetical protein [Mesorhizobium sp.]RWK39291.1 MAG: hypothetical protein EOR40_04575 [Mesorhizobium sp.]
MTPEQVSSDPVQPTRETLAKPLDLSALLRDAFLAGRGLKDGDKLSDDDQAAWMAYDPELMPAYKRITASLDLARRAASSAPEAGKAVDWKRAFAAQSRKLEAVLHIPGVREIIRDLKWDEQSIAALASVPAPSGAERIAEFAKAILHGDDEHRAWLTEAAVAFNAGEPLPPPRGKGTGPAPQAVPAEDIAGLVGRAITRALAWQPSEDGPSYQTTRKEVEGLLTTASEAEASDLRRKLEEARKALEPFGCENDLPPNLPDSTRLNITFEGQQVAHATFGDFRRARTLSGAS